MTKKLFILLITAFAFYNLSAQTSDHIDGIQQGSWSSAFIEWNPGIYIVDGRVAHYNGTALGFSRSFALSDRSNLLLETGAAVQLSYYNNSDDEEKLNLASIKIPINFMYRINCLDNKVAVLPFMGITARGNFWGEMKTSGHYIDLYDKTEMGGKDETWKRIQIAWQIGLKIRFNQHLIIGSSYGYDFNNIAKRIKIHTGAISIGYTY